MGDPLIVVAGDRLRLTKPLVETIVRAVRAGEDHLIVDDATLVEREGIREITLVVAPGSRTVLPKARDLKPQIVEGLKGRD